ncbi:uncharacterized protein LOC122629451 [Vespula pensylvanica]|uniref:uncharacterized protein LOC122629451 n=1 Tax=Vespula pensylvanica TaxID=30213 RepID=UPI001CBA4128|nr:uncharacterized protein LOC122629451 [Vespula pensylvanica]XP_043668798.1 uncharacterized protein LOC122629451 [Vespula pensylvanica]XP_043668799.1 uncharacterized protein LOC122629451 [Vespula pensylvanica]
MKFTWTLCGLLLISGFVASNPIVKRDAENDLSPLNEVYVFEADEDQKVDDERTDRDKRKIGIVKLGVSNGVINFVFGKLDAFLDAKTKALTVLDESNKAKNAAFGIDNSQSATSQFIGNLVSQKIQAGTASIGPVISSASTFFNSAKSGLTNAFVSKLAPLSSIAGGLSGGGGVSVGGGVSADSGASSAATSQLLSNLLSSKLGVISNLSSASNSGTSGSSNGNGASGAGAAAGINLGAFANLGGKIESGSTTTTTEENIPMFDRQKVSLDIPPPVFGSGFTLITNISRILSNIILNSARRTQTLLEIFKPFFRGVFAIKGLPSDNPH